MKVILAALENVAPQGPPKLRATKGRKERSDQMESMERMATLDSLEVWD